MTNFVVLFFFNDTATTEIYTLSLHDALPISLEETISPARTRPAISSSGARTTSMVSCSSGSGGAVSRTDRKSTRLNSSHANISYAVFCLKKKTQQIHRINSCEENI